MNLIMSSDIAWKLRHRKNTTLQCRPKHRYLFSTSYINTIMGRDG